MIVRVYNFIKIMSLGTQNLSGLLSEFRRVDHSMPDLRFGVFEPEISDTKHKIVVLDFVYHRKNLNWRVLLNLTK